MIDLQDLNELISSVLLCDTPDEVTAIQEKLEAFNKELSPLCDRAQNELLQRTLNELYDRVCDAITECVGHEKYLTNTIAERAEYGDYEDRVRATYYQGVL